jgi:tol-pal system protein YbgF
VWVAVALAAVPGCTSQLSMVKSDNQRLRAQVTELRADKRRTERRIRELENELLLADRADTAALDRGKRPGTPALPVEVMAPTADDGLDDLGDNARVVDVADDGTAIVYVDDAATGKQGTWGDDDERDDPPASAPAAKRKPREPDRLDVDVDVSDDRDASERYHAAVGLLRAGRHDDAIAAFRKFVRENPKHGFADNAQYWLGEAYYDRKDYTRALAEFRAAVDKFPRGNKVPDALLKVGYCYLALGQTDKGRFALEQVIAIYPKTEPALLAGKRLEALPR